MAITLTNALFAKQRALPETRKPHIQLLLKAFFSFHEQHNGNKDLQFVPFAALDDTETVIADATCRIYATYMKKGTGATAAYVKQTDSATTSSDASSEFRFEMNEASQEEMVIYAKGALQASGVTMQGNTTANGGTASAAADAVSGFVIIGAP